MKTSWALVGTCLLVLVHPTGTLRAQRQELETLDSAVEVLQAFGALSVKSIPPALLQDARGVAVIPNVVKAGFVLGGRFGRGVVLIRQADGTWGNPVFLTLAGGGIGWQAGVQSTDLVLVFKTSNGLDRILRGQSKLTLGADVGVAAGPVGREAAAATDGQLKAEIYSYSRSRGLFAGLSVEGAGLLMDCEANEALYQVRGGRPADVMALRGVPLPAQNLKVVLAKLSTPPAPVVYPVAPVPALWPPVPPPPPPAVAPAGPPPPKWGPPGRDR